MQRRPVALAIGLGLLGLALTACATTVKPEDSGDTCTELCTGVLTLNANTGASEFSLIIFGDGFSNLQIGCPDNVRAGGDSEVTAECSGGGVTLQREGLPFPETLTVAASVGTNAGPEQTLAPDYTEEITCSHTCNSASATFEVPQ